MLVISGVRVAVHRVINMLGLGANSSVNDDTLDDWKVMINKAGFLQKLKCASPLII